MNRRALSSALRFLATLALFCSVAVVPLVARMVLEPDAGAAAFLRGDLFILAKSMGVRVLAAVAVLATAGLTLLGGTTGGARPPQGAPSRVALGGATALVVAAVASAVLSPHGATAWAGSAEIYDGAAVNLAYLGLFLSSLIVFQSPAAMARLPVALAVPCLILGAFAAAALLDFDPMLTAPVQRLILGAAAYDGGSRLQEGVGGIIAGTLGNPNYFGHFMAMSWPVFLGLAVTGRSATGRLAFGAVAWTTFFALLASASRGSYVAAAVGAVIVVVGVRSRIRRGAAFGIAVLLVAHLAAFFAHDTLSDAMAQRRASQIVPELQSGFAPWFHPGLGADANAAPSSTIKRAQIVHGRLHLPVTHATALVVERQADGVRFMDEGFRPLGVHRDGPRFVFDDLRYDRSFVQPWALGGLRMVRIGSAWGDFQVALTPAGPRVLLGGTLIAPAHAVRADLPISDALLSGRGYIWSRTLALLGGTWWLGRGPGTFVLDFPNADLTAAHYHFGKPMTVDKPHNFYLQIAHGSGNLAALTFLAMLAWYGWRTSRGLRAGTFATALPILIAAGVASYAVGGIVNDAIVGTAPAFWIFFGAGFAALKEHEALSAPRLKRRRPETP